MRHSFETVAAFRFGYGFGPKTVDPRGADALLAQVNGPDAGLAAFSGMDYSARMALMHDYTRLKKIIRSNDNSVKPDLRVVNQTRRAVRANDVRHVFQRALFSGQDFRERLIFFWADHFTVIPKSRTEATIWGTYQETAIRPHVGGTFADLLVSAIMHPSMLLFLDQVRSVGPNSAAAKNWKKKKRRQLGLNENLAREVLELHTMGVGGGYAQSDVRQLAELLTGLVKDDLGAAFNPRLAEPGSETVLGVTYGGGSAKVDDIEAFLRDVAVHPDTAAHISQKLAVHFVSDDPDPDLVAKMTAKFLETGGDLMQVYSALLDHPSAWVDLGQKAKQPFDFTVSALRALGVTKDFLGNLTDRQVDRFLAVPLLSMGQPLRAAPGPNGWPEEAEAWITPQGVAARVQWSLAMALQLGGEADPREFVEMALRDVAGQTLRQAVAGAEQRPEGLALVLASPEFNRR